MIHKAYGLKVNDVNSTLSYPLSVRLIVFKIVDHLPQAIYLQKGLLVRQTAHCTQQWVDRFEMGLLSYNPC